jgi:hypothetical protein
MCTENKHTCTYHYVHTHTDTDIITHEAWDGTLWPALPTALAKLLNPQSPLVDISKFDSHGPIPEAKIPIP